MEAPTLASLWTLAVPSAHITARDPMQLIVGSRYVGIVGSRSYPHLDRVTTLVGLLDTNTIVVSGGAPGVDQHAMRCAGERGLHGIVIRPARETNAGLASDYMLRNTAIVRSSDVVIAFWNGDSHGTKDSIEKALLIHGMVVVAVEQEKAAVWEK